MHLVASIAGQPVQPPDGFGLHAPDGIVPVPIAILMWALTMVVLAVAVRRTNARLDERAIPLMGVTAAFIFAAQMVNFPIIGGTSGHLLGGVLAAVLLGPWAGTLVMACVVAVQGLLFQDGGLLIMGANIFNMGVVGTLGGYGLYRSLCHVLGGEDRARIPAAGIAAWVAVMAGAASMSVQLVASGPPVEIVLPAMLSVHALIGIGEALITMAALAFIAATRADLFKLRDAGGPIESGSTIVAGNA
jgi:cobalt/nickel transport system permease protein